MGRTSSGFRPPNSPPWSVASFVSRWLTVDQERIDAFAKVTEDEQFIHVDPERAAETAFGGHHRPRLPHPVVAVHHGL